jgi:diphosphate-dependent phosphofructokinase
MPMSPLQKKRLQYRPELPVLLREGSFHALSKGGVRDEIAKFFPRSSALTSQQLGKGSKTGRKMTVGVLFSGGQAAGGHNVIAGLFDGLQEVAAGSRLLGCLKGVSGLLANQFRELSAQEIDAVRNQGGFDLIGSGRAKIDTEEELVQAAQCAKALDALVVIGGDDSNTNAAVLAEYFLQHNIATQIIGVPKTIDADVRSEDIELSFGFDSACKTYSELIGNIARDAVSARKYYHFIKLMGRSASHITLECALATCPNLALIGEERRSLSQVVKDMVQLIEQRKALGKEYGVVLIPEGIIEFMPEMQELISLLNAGKKEHLPESHRALFQSLPEKIQEQLLLARDPHGNIRLSQIETEQFLLTLVKKEVKVNGQTHFFGYEGRACLPSNFDATYCNALGHLAALAIRDGLTGVVMAVQNLKKRPADWNFRAIPIVQLMRTETRLGKQKPVIAKALVDLQGSAYRTFEQARGRWRLEDCYQMPGPIQFFGDPELTDTVPLSISLSS